MRTVTITLNSLVAVFFAAFLGYTFVARQHLNSLARRFVTEKTLHYSEPIVEIADESRASPIVQKLLTNEQADAIRREIAKYRSDPPAYVSDLTRQTMRIERERNPNPLLKKVSAIKERIRTFYENTLAALIRDLRIFSASNLCAGVISLGLAVRSRGPTRPATVWFSFLMFVAVLYCSFLYVDDLTFFRILFRTHPGWWYAAFLCVVLVGLYWNYGYCSEETGAAAAP